MKTAEQPEMWYQQENGEKQSQKRKEKKTILP